MTNAAQVQIGRLYRDLDGAVVRLESVMRKICRWSAVEDEASGVAIAATHIDNFCRRFVPLAAVMETVNFAYPFRATRSVGGDLVYAIPLESPPPTAEQQSSPLSSADQELEHLWETLDKLYSHGADQNAAELVISGKPIEMGAH